MKKCAALGLLAITLVACGRSAERTGFELPPPEVSIVVIQPESILLTMDLPGRTVPYRVADIRPQVSGLILRRLFEEGSEVEAGQVLYEIDPAPFEAALASANAAMERAQAALTAARIREDRVRRLLDEQAVSQQDYDDVSAALQQIEAEVRYTQAQAETARIQLQHTRVTAPIPGRIGRSTVTDGALVIAYQPIPLATIQQLDPIYVDVPQSATERLRLQRRMAEGHLTRGGERQRQVDLITADGGTYPLTGSLQFEDVTVDSLTGSVILRAVFPNPDGVLLPGMFVRAILAEGMNEQALLVSQQAVSRTPRGDPFVMVVDESDTAQMQMITIDRVVGHHWLVSSGLQVGDRVIVEGLVRVRPGMPVRVAPAESVPAT